MGVEFDLKEFAAFNSSLVKLSQSGNLQKFNKQVLKELSWVYVREAKLNTPVGKRSVKIMQNGKVQTKYFDTEHTRQSWIVGRYRLSNRTGRIKVFNTSSYASFLNDGHRQEVGKFLPWLGQAKGGIMQGGRLKKPWVDGAYMHEKAEKVVNKNAKRIMEITLKKWVEEHGGF
ncbi:MAG: HK97 gp10 family phage protein [Veillonella sp.]|nr:MAG: HK97 gp10 family phage protein [Veillonella sp.]